MKIYIAARYSRRDEMRQVRDKLIKRGHTVTSRWLDEKSNLNGHMGDESTEFYKETCCVDLNDIDEAKYVLFFAEDPKVGTPRGGRHVEFGYALGRKYWIDVIGPKENVFHYDPFYVTHYSSLEDYLATH